MRGLLLSLALLTGCAGGNYQLKGPNHAAPEQQVTPLPGEQVEANTTKEIFPWVVWGTLILGSLVWLWKDWKSTEEKTD